MLIIPIGIRKIRMGKKSKKRKNNKEKGRKNIILF